MTTTAHLTQVGQPRTDVDTCDLCGHHARRAIVVRDADGREFYAADKCARLMLGYDPFKAQR
jgi:hypothetical protein